MGTINTSQGRSSKNKIRRYLVTVALLAIFSVFSPGMSLAADLESGLASIKNVASYSEWQGGDVIFRITTNNIPGCSGYWLSPNDPGFKTNVAVVTSAYLASATVRVIADSTRKWYGGVDICHVSAVSLTKQ